MKLIKRNPDLQLFDNLFDSFFRDEPLHWMEKSTTTNRSVAVNIHEDDKAYHLEVLAPGFTKEDISLDVEEGLLNIKAKKEEREEKSDRNYSRIEFRRANFERSFRLPENEIKEDEIEASFVNGILEITLPKENKVEKKLKKLIEIA